MDVVHADDIEALTRATAALDAGELAIVPSELGDLLVADALNDDAIDALYVAARRPADEPVTVCVAGYEDHQHVAFGTPLAHAIAQRDWPGPTTLALKPRPWVPEAITAGTERVRVMAPGHAFANALARHFGPYACVPAPRGVSAAIRVEGVQVEPVQPDVVDATGVEAKLIRGKTGGGA